MVGHYPAHPQPGVCTRLSDVSDYFLYNLPSQAELDIWRCHVQDAFLFVQHKHVRFYYDHYADESTQTGGSGVAQILESLYA